MSNAIFPTFDGLAWSVLKTPSWKTAIQTAVSGKEVRSAYQVRPKWLFTLTYEVLRNFGGMTEFNQMLAFFNARRGSFDSFLYLDPSDNTVTAQPIGVGDGTNRDFPLLHTISGWTEPVGYGSVFDIYVDGVHNGNNVYINGNSGIRFDIAPAAGAVITWSGTFYYRVRFAKDQMEFDQFMKDFWALKKCEFVGVFDA